jgi:hypothetical protein
VTGPESPVHVVDELPALLAGECGREQTLAVAAHLRICSECRDELVSAAVAASALRAAARAEWVPSVIPTPSTPPATTPANAAPITPVTPDPWTSSTSSVASDSETPEWLTRISRPGPARHSAARHEPGRSSRRRLAVIAAAVVVIAGAIAAALGLAASGPPVLSQAALHPLQAPAAAHGAVTVTAASGARQVQVSTGGLPAPGQGHYYEVWLLDPATLKMMPMGALPPSGQASFGVATGLMTGYSAVDISLQANNGNPAHSAVSVLRGTLGT